MVRLDGSVKKLTPDDHHLLHPIAQAIHSLAYEGGLGIKLAPGVLTQSREYAVLMSFPTPEREHVCLGYYSHEKLERKKVILDVNKPYPKELKPLGQCTLIAIVPDGRRLVLQEGRLTTNGEKRRVWVWDIEARTVTPIAWVGWITQIYGWLGTEWMVVEVRGEPIEVEHDVWEKDDCEKGNL